MKENTAPAFRFASPQPAPEPADLAALLDEIFAIIRLHVVLSEQAAAALALWVVHTYVFDHRDAVAYVSIESPEKRCGKTTLLSVLAGMACKALVASNITVSALFRVIDETGPTLLIDEADTFLGGNSVMRGILNCGNTWRTAYVLRLSGRKKAAKAVAAQQQQAAQETGESSLVRYSCWCPKVIAMIGRVPETIADRSIVVRLERKLVSEKCAPLSEFQPEGITAKCVRFANDNAENIARAAIETASGLNDRAADTFEPLLVLARMAGPAWFERATAAAQFLTSSENCDIQGAGLLLDIITVFIDCGAEKMFSRELVSALRGEEQWIASQYFADKTLNELTLAQHLKSYGLKPVTLRIGEEVNKGYRVADFKHALHRYVPSKDIEARKEETEARVALHLEARAETEARRKRQAEAQREERRKEAEEFAGYLATAGQAAPLP